MSCGRQGKRRRAGSRISGDKKKKSPRPMNEKIANNETRPEKELLREQAVRALLARQGDQASQGVIEGLKRDLGVSRATAYRIIKTFRTCGAVTSSSGRPVGRPKGARVLDAKRESIIHDAIAAFLAHPTRPKFSQLVRDIGERCQEAQLPVPNWRTIKARANDSDLAARAQRRTDSNS